MIRRLPAFLAGLFFLLGLPLRAAENPSQQNEVRFVPISMESAPIQPFRHSLSFRSDFALDAFTATRGTESLKGLYTRAQPSLEYRYAPGNVAEIFFRVLYTAQNIDLRSGSGARVDSTYSAGAGQPTVGFKLPFSPSAAMELRTSPPTEARNKTPRLGDGALYGGDLLFKAGRWHFSTGHTVRLPYDVQGATETERRAPGGVTELAMALVSKDVGTAKKDFVGTVFELHGVYSDRERLDGQGVKSSSALAGRGVFGFVLGKINPGCTHLTQVAVSIGVGRGLHETQDPLFGIGDIQLTLGYKMLWGRNG